MWIYNLFYQYIYSYTSAWKLCSYKVQSCGLSLTYCCFQSTEYQCAHAFILRIFISCYFPLINTHTLSNTYFRMSPFHDLYFDITLLVTDVFIFLYFQSAEQQWSQWSNCSWRLCYKSSATAGAKKHEFCMYTLRQILKYESTIFDTKVPK